MADLSRIAPAPTLEQVEREAFHMLRLTQAAPNIDNIKRCADLWRIYERKLGERFPDPRGRPAA